jgi:hypothetical protein
MLTWRAIPGAYTRRLADDPNVLKAIALNESSLTWNAKTAESAGGSSYGPFMIYDKYARDLYVKRARIGASSALLKEPPVATPVIDSGNPEWGPILATYPSALGYGLVKAQLATDFLAKHWTVTSSGLVPKSSTKADTYGAEKAIADLANKYVKLGGAVNAAVAIVIQLWWKGSSFTYVTSKSKTAEGDRIAAKTARAYAHVKGSPVVS